MAAASVLVWSCTSRLVYQVDENWVSWILVPAALFPSENEADQWQFLVSWQDMTPEMGFGMIQYA